MRIGLHLTPFWSPSDRSATQMLDEAIQVVRAASTMGFAWVSVGQHLLSHPTFWPQPFPLLARLAPETGDMRLKTSMLLLPILNPVEVAENVATLDHLCHGRLTVGVAMGYREVELETVGLTRKDRARKVEESIALMKQLWSGEEVTFQGKYANVTRGRMGFRPYQQPHPPIEMGANSEAATRRAARIADGVLFGPQDAWEDVTRMATVYREERRAQGREEVGFLGASRSLIVGTSKDDARARAEAYLERTFALYSTWRIQESSMVPLQLNSSINLDGWSVNGSPADCVEAVLRARDEVGLNAISFTIYSLPRAPEARIEYLQMIAEEIVAKVA